jgi:hypothetical protein
MATLNDAVLIKLREKYGDSVQLTSGTPLLHDILTELGHLDPIGPLAGYDKTYTEGYNKEDYSRGDYHRYDRTVDVYNDRIHEIQPEIDKLILERLKASLER